MRDKPSELDQDDVPEAAVKERRRFSIVWLIPLVAGAIGIWLAYVTISEQGPTITMTFKTAEGLEAGKTKIKYKDVEVGRVEEVELSEDFSHIVVTAQMDKSAAHYMNEGTRFWIVRPRIGLGGVSGLGTLVSGSYVELEPGEGTSTTSFTGLEEPPPITSDVPGRRFVLRATELGSVARGSPLYFRGIEVGKVLSHQLADDDRTLMIDFFVNAPHDRLVEAESRFWNASGLRVSMSAEGVDVRTESLQALAIGGIAFDTPADVRSDTPAEEGHVFHLYDSFRSVSEAAYTEKQSLIWCTSRARCGV